MSILDTGGGVVFPLGFSAAYGYCGVKKPAANEAEQTDDLCLIFSERPAAAAACFTRNKVCAAPVTWDKGVIEKGGTVRGVVINSGNANAVTGKKGLEDCEDTAAAFAEGVGESITKEEVFVCSTGVIGVPLPIENITEGVKELAKRLSRKTAANAGAAKAIMTTDTYHKTASITVRVGNIDVRIGGMAKGSGMIHPDMATLLAYITTDAKIERGALAAALKASVEETYNMISVDGDTSTNDTIIALANGAAGNDEIRRGTREFIDFARALNEINKKLAIDIAKDGEGATKLIECAVINAGSAADARLIAKGVISSALFKAAMFGSDANWGRALCAMGYSGGEFEPAKVSLAFGRRGEPAYEKLRVLESGEPVKFSEEAAKELLQGEEILVEVDLNVGTHTATAWGCDLTYDYVKINGDYRS